MMRTDEVCAVNPVLIILPLTIVVSGLTCFFILPMPLATRALILVVDLIVAGILGVCALAQV